MSTSNSATAMLASGPALLHVVGYLTGLSLYAMLLGMVIRTRGADYRLTVATAVLGLTWNLGALAAQTLDGFHLALARDAMAAVSYVSLGFLAAVAVHSAGRRRTDESSGPFVARTSAIALAAYAVAGLAGALQLSAAARRAPLPSPTALVLVTVGLAALSVPLLLTTRRQPHRRRALWMTALALAAVSALHLGRFHGAAENWFTGLLGHHASIPLAFAILYQDFRFAFADLFLKRAVTLLVLVTAVFSAWTVLEPSFLLGSPGTLRVGLLLALWIATALAFPALHRGISTFVDRIVLRRVDYETVIERFAMTIHACDSEQAVLSEACTVLARVLNAESVTSSTSRPVNGLEAHAITIATAEEPRPHLFIGRLTGGRRLLSDDTLLLERIALLAGRRIDTLRLQDERYERMLREREISTLAAEAELRALRAQINPHFLFNALTTLGYLIQSAPSRALETLMHLTTLLRSALRSDGEFTTLGHERELVECYLQIEQERFEERLEVHVDVPEALNEIAIPSFIVQPLVENAIKHGVARSLTGGRVSVCAQLDEAASPPQLRITVRNTGAPLTGRATSTGGGIGLTNVERRLRCYYGMGADLLLSRAENGETVAALTLPLDGAFEVKRAAWATQDDL